MSVKQKENYLDNPKKTSKEENQSENLILDGETLDERKKKKKEYQENNLNESY